MVKNKNADYWRRPEMVLAELLNKSARGDFLEKDANVRLWHRAIVTAVDVYGGKLENQDGSGDIEHIVDGKKVSISANIGPTNPKNSVKARIITDEFDQFLDDDQLRVFWPLMPEHDSVPIKPGEHVYVMFEDEESNHGLWLGKVPGHEGVNFFRGEDGFLKGPKSLNSMLDGEDADSSPNSTDKAASGRVISTGLNDLLDA